MWHTFKQTSWRKNKWIELRLVKAKVIQTYDPPQLLLGYLFRFLQHTTTGESTQTTSWRRNWRTWLSWRRNWRTWLSPPAILENKDCSMTSWRLELAMKTTRLTWLQVTTRELERCFKCGVFGGGCYYPLFMGRYIGSGASKYGSWSKWPQKLRIFYKRILSLRTKLSWLWKFEDKNKRFFS